MIHTDELGAAIKAARAALVLEARIHKFQKKLKQAIAAQNEMSATMSDTFTLMKKLAAEQRKRQLAQERLNLAVSQGDAALEHLHVKRKDDKLQVAVIELEGATKQADAAPPPCPDSAPAVSERAEILAAAAARKEATAELKEQHELCDQQMHLLHNVLQEDLKQLAIDLANTLETAVGVYVADGPVGKALQLQHEMQVVINLRSAAIKQLEEGCRRGHESMGARGGDRPEKEVGAVKGAAAEIKEACDKASSEMVDHDTIELGHVLLKQMAGIVKLIPANAAMRAAFAKYDKETRADRCDMLEGYVPDLVQALAQVLSSGVEPEYVAKEQKQLDRAQHEIEFYRGVVVRLQKAHKAALDTFAKLQANKKVKREHLQVVVEELQAAVFKAEDWHLDPVLVKESQGTLTLIRAHFRSMH